MSFKSSLKKLVRKFASPYTNVLKKTIRKNPELAKIAGGVLTMTPLAPIGVALATTAQLSELSGKTVPQQEAAAEIAKQEAIMNTEQQAATKAAINVAGSTIPSDRDGALAASYDSGATGVPLRRFEPTLRAISGRATPRRKRKAARRAAPKRRARRSTNKLKFGSPAWRKKFMKRRK